MSTYVIPANTRSDPIPAGANSVVNVTGIASAIEYTQNSTADVSNGVATWANLSLINSSAIVNEKILIRVITGAASVTINTVSAPTQADKDAFVAPVGATVIPSRSVLRAISVGDSLANYYSVQFGANLSVSKGIGTLDANGTTIWEGNKFFISNLNNLTHQDTGRPLTAISGFYSQAGSGVVTYASLAPDGDYGLWGAAPVHSSFDSTFMSFIRLFSDTPFQLVGQYALGSTTSAYTLAMLKKCIDQQPSELVFWTAGTNDLLATTTEATAQAAAISVFNNTAAAIDIILSRGKTAIINIPGPLNTAPTGAINAGLMQLRNYLLPYFRRKGVYVVDSFSEAINGLEVSSGTYFISGGTNDGVHPNSSLVCRIGRNQAKSALPVTLPTLDLQGVSGLEDSTIGPHTGITYPNIAVNPGMIGTAGAVVGCVAGSTSPTGYGFTVTGAATVTSTAQWIRTKVADKNTPNQGYATRIQCTSTGAGQGFTFFATSVPARVTLGDQYEFGYQIYIRSTTEGNPTLYAATNWGFGTQYANAPGLATNGATYLSGDNFTLQGGFLKILRAPVSNQMYVLVSFAGAGFIDLEISSPFQRKTDDYYVQ